MKDFYQLKKNLKNDFSGLKDVKVALLGDSATQFLTIALRGVGFDYGFNLDIWEADFNQIERQVFDAESELFKFDANFIIIFFSSHKLLSKYNKISSANTSTFAKSQLELIETIYHTLILKNPKANIILYNLNEIDDAVFGNFANKLESSFLFQLRLLNCELLRLANKYPNLHLVDLSSIQNLIGKNAFYQSSIYVNTDMVLSINALPLIAARCLDLIAAINGQIKKCVILDLDNTLWGGVIGDDGLENIHIGSLGIGKAYTEFQYWLKKLKNRGIILAVCSKNTEAIAKEVFTNHPEMVLKLEDISVFIANWDNKVNNIRHIQSILNIGFDSMVFLDDNPFERNLVRENISNIIVPELPEDPAEYLEYLYTLNLFETVTFSVEDLERTKLYQIESQRKEFQNHFVNEDSFLEQLNMYSLVQAFNKFNTPRVAQLSQRSNQFNLRTVRYTETDIEHISQSDNYFTLSFTLEDKFGDNGLICVIILKKEATATLFIDTWFMSCRVLKRGMENFVLNTIVELAKQQHFTMLKAEYIPTKKNDLVKNHYADLGFEKIDDYYFLNVLNYQSRKCFIQNKTITEGFKYGIK